MARINVPVSARFAPPPEDGGPELRDGKPWIILTFTQGDEGWVTMDSQVQGWQVYVAEQRPISPYVKDA